MDNKTSKGVGRRSANCWGRPRRTYAKRSAAKAVRRSRKVEVDNEIETFESYDPLNVNEAEEHGT